MTDPEPTNPVPPGASLPAEEKAVVEVHKPKAVHGWRELFNEIGVIVIGVLIALGAEQVVEALHWRHQIEAGEETMRDDARFALEYGAWREAQSPCIGRRLGDLATVLDQASTSGRLPAVGQLGGPGSGTVSFPSWDSLVAAQVAPRLPRERFAQYANIAGVLGSIAVASREEQDNWAVLYTLVGPGRRISDAEQAQARAALSRAVLAAKRQRTLAEGMKGAIAASGLLPRGEIDAIRTKAGRAFATEQPTYMICKPLATTPRADTYGQAPSPVDLSARFKP